MKKLSSGSELVEKYQSILRILNKLLRHECQLNYFKSYSIALAFYTLFIYSRKHESSNIS